MNESPPDLKYAEGLYESARSHGFFCYASTRDGDLYRSAKYPGRRVILTGASATVQARRPTPWGIQWVTVKSWSSDPYRTETDTRPRLSEASWPAAIEAIEGEVRP